ncbi:hypothetical protein LINPERHAP1_LOCUS7363 [Linum perenne]
MRLNLEDHVDLVYRIDRVLQAYGYVVPAIVGMQALPPEHMTDLVVEVVPPDTTMGIGQVRSVRPRTEAPMTMNVQRRRVVDRETGIAQTGYGVAYFLDTGNMYFAGGFAFIYFWGGTYSLKEDTIGKAGVIWDVRR